MKKFLVFLSFVLMFTFLLSTIAFSEENSIVKKAKRNSYLTNSPRVAEGQMCVANQKNAKGAYKHPKRNSHLSNPVEMKAFQFGNNSIEPKKSTSPLVPAEGQVIYLGPAESVQVDEGGEPGKPDWDPSIPVNLAPPSEPEWVEKIEEERRERELEAPDLSINPVDISSPDTPSSFLIPTSDISLRDLGAGSVSVAGYPAAAPSGCPPDVTLNVGANHIVEGYNSYFEVKNKSGTYLSRFNMSTLFSGLTNCGNATTGYLCDPQVIYDECAAGTCPNPTDTRWVLTALWVNSAGSDSRLCVAVSKQGQNPYPTTNFWVYEIDPPGTGIADYPHTGIQDDAIIIGYNWFGSGYATVVAINKSKVYAGQVLGAGDTATYTLGTNNTPQPANRIGCKQSQWPAAGTRFYIPTTDGTGNLDLYVWNQPTLSNSPSLLNDNLVVSGGTCTNPSGTYFAATYPVDCLGARWMDSKLRYPYLWAVRSSIQTYDAFQWAQINISGTPSVTASGEIYETNNQMIQPDAAVDSQQNLAVVYTKASQTNSIYLGAYVTGRQGTTWGSGLTVQTGKRQYSIGCVQNNVYRWGDYNGAAVDPEDGCTIYVNGQYVRNTTTQIQDGSWVASYRFANCSGVVPQAYLNKGEYFCVDDVSATIFDPTGTPTNAVYHTEHGTVSGTISGTAPNFTVSPTTITALNGVNGDHVWLTFTAGDSNNYSSPQSIVDCAVKLCLYQVDDLSGGCDNDKYHDQGEVLNYQVAIANLEESRNLPSPFQCTVSTGDTNIQDVNNPAYYPALDSYYYAYPIPSHAFRYVGSIASYCNTPINFTVDCQAIDGSYWMDTSDCSSLGFPNTFSKVANYESPTVIQQDFNAGGTFPPAGWIVQHLGGTAGCDWDYGSNTQGRDNYTGGTGDYADANSDFCGSGTTMDTALVTPVFSIPTGASVAQLEFKHAFADYYSSSYGYVQISTTGQGGTYTTLATYGPCAQALCDSGTKTISLTSYLGQSNCALRWRFVSNDWNLFWQVDDVRVDAGDAGCETSVCTPAPLLTYGNYTEMDDTACNNNLYPEPGDVGDTFIYLDNTGNDWAYNTTATLSCPTCDSVFGAGAIEICDNTATYGNIPSNDNYVYAPPPSSTFNIAIDPSVVCNPSTQTTIPFQMTLSADNLQGNPPQANPISTPVPLGAEGVTNASSNGFTYEERFQLDPGATGSNGRYGFTSAWTESNGASIYQLAGTNECSGFDFWPADDNFICEMTGKNVARTITHTFSTAAPNIATTNVWIAWSWDIGTFTAAHQYRLYYNDGVNGWRQLAASNGDGSGTGNGWECWRGSLYYSVQSQWPGDEDLVLNNPNLQIRLHAQFGNANAIAHFGDYYQRNYSYLCESSSCSGQCPTVSVPPPTPNNDDVPGQPFILTKGTNPGTVHTTWDTSCGSPENFNIYWGNLNTLGTTNTVTQANCGIGTSGNVDNLTSPNPSAGEGYWAVITAVAGSEFGRHGNDSNGNERTLTGDAAACGGTKNTSKNDCSTFFASQEPVVYGLHILNQKKAIDESKEVISKVPCETLKEYGINIFPVKKDIKK